MRLVLSVSTLGELVGLYARLKKPKEMLGGCETFFFRKGVKPLWEDKENLNGGCLFLHIKKTFSNRIWENLLCSVVAEHSPELKKVNGIIMRVLPLEVVFFVWTKEVNKAEEAFLIGWLRETAGLSSKIKLEFKPHPKTEEEKFIAVEEIKSLGATPKKDPSEAERKDPPSPRGFEPV